MKYAVNSEGIQAMNTMAKAITDAIEEISTLTSNIQSTADGYQDTLGPHKADLDEALSDIKDSIAKASEPANSVSEKLMDVAEGYQEVLDNNRFRKSGN